MAFRDIKTKIQATERTHKVTRAMEAVSAVKMRTTQSTALAGRPYARAALSILARLSGSADIMRHPLAHVRRAERCALVILTSDKGLAGALNSGVIKAAAEAVAAYPVAAVTVYAYGKKGEEYFARRGYRIARAFENKQDVVEFSVMEELAAELSQEFMKETYDEVLVAYSNFKSTFEQVPAVRRLLPLTLANIEQLVRDIVPVKNASDKSREVAHDLTRLFNKIRQAGITREVSEIVGGREALTT